MFEIFIFHLYIYILRYNEKKIHFPRILFKHVIEEASTIIWNGPVGVYEFGKFAAGTKVD